MLPADAGVDAPTWDLPLFDTGVDAGTDAGPTCAAPTVPGDGGCVCPVGGPGRGVFVQMCGAACVDLTQDSDCGGCGLACPAGSHCHYTSPVVMPTCQASP